MGDTIIKKKIYHKINLWSYIKYTFSEVSVSEEENSELYYSSDSASTSPSVSVELSVSNPDWSSIYSKNSVLVSDLAWC